MAFDVNNPDHLLELKNEVTLDPNGYGYVPGNTITGVLEIINLVRPEITVNKPKVSAAKIRSATIYDGYDGLSIDEQEWLRWMTGSNGFEEENIPVTPDFREHLVGDTGNSIWAVSDKTYMEAEMRSIFDRAGSRAEELFGYETTISRNDWLAARNV